MRFGLRILIGGLLLVSACGGNDEAGTSTTSTTSTSTAETSTAGVSTTEATLSDLTGRWENQEMVLEVNSGGEYVVRRPGDDTGALMGGFVARDGQEFSFVTGTTGECPGQTGIYLAMVDSDILTLTLVDDPCELRLSGFAGPFTRSG